MENHENWLRKVSEQNPRRSIEGTPRRRLFQDVQESLNLLVDLARITDAFQEKKVTANCMACVIVKLFEHSQNRR